MSEEEIKEEPKVLEDDDRLHTLQGEIVDLSRKFWRDGWGFGKLRVTGVKKEVIKITGTLEGFKLGQLVSVTGKYKTGKYGTELAIETIIVDAPNDHRGVQQWLLEKLPQIGPQRAAEIGRRFGGSIWDVLDQNPDALLEIDGITPDRVADIVRAWFDHKEERERIVPYYDLGLNHAETKKAIREEISAADLKRDPFSLYFLVSGVSFARADLIAAKTDAPTQHPTRLLAALVEVTKQAAFDGHTAVDDEYLLEHASALSGVQPRALEPLLNAACSPKHELLVQEPHNGFLMFPPLARAEEGIADKIKELTRGRHRTGPDAGRSRSHDAQRASGDRDGRPGDREEHHPRQLSLSYGREADRAGGPDWEGGEEDS